jgi:hypothetical protein
MDFKVFLEIFGSFNYVVPSDREKQMYDFYMLANLRGMENKRNTIQYGNIAGKKPYYEPGNFEPGELEAEEKQLDYMLEEISDKLLPYLKNELLEVLFRAISGEVKDALYFNDTYVLELMVKDKFTQDYSSFEKFIKNLVDYMEPKEKDKEEDWGSWWEKGDKFSEKDIEDISSRKKSRRKDPLSDYRVMSYGSFQKNPSGHVVSEIAKKSFTDIDAFVRIAKFLFLKADWSENYGGQNWANIVDGYFKLKSATNKNQLIIAIDHVYDLQHNTGTIFTKNSDYAKKTRVISSTGAESERLDYSWIKDALDFKRDLHSANELLDKISSSFKKLAVRIIKNKNLG